MSSDDSPMVKRDALAVVTMRAGSCEGARATTRATATAPAATATASEPKATPRHARAGLIALRAGA
jgi:hypothetical protein